MERWVQLLMAVIALIRFVLEMQEWVSKWRKKWRRHKGKDRMKGL
ncbi:hypothetical protein GCM10011571_04260 [Marinithermofilum abyssi]|uniref:Uncharacterized protein n=1 Tax=Marinithermofilum abyssi TaxID=1571185 RepID=A0A8J2Y8M7_9BACL|nr:hypothetical protein [Marinithermofilum abyssi]GGE06300.1 hypothetical protein GCM10011571_04260 [Marinithermofilum abyssi]